MWAAKKELSMWAAKKEWAMLVLVYALSEVMAVACVAEALWQ
jgi:hypothetical protein